MSRYQLIDVQTGEVVREERTTYGTSNFTRRKKSFFTPHEQDTIIFCLIGVIIGAVIF
ncbi:hypothetical protein [Arthrobacter sp. KNU40]|uniref:hypothetical protein n=1 Tax=Arthrobacter sp. KNU40 TaxID=3447965 RepID=UPI003F617B73